MNSQYLTDVEIEEVREFCFSNPAKACALAQEIINTCQVVSCKTYAEINGKSKRTILYDADNLNGVIIDNRKFISICQ